MEVLEASSAPGLAMASSLVNTSRFTSMVSNTASMIKSASASAFQSVVGVNSAIRFATSPSGIEPRLTAVR